MNQFEDTILTLLELDHGTTPAAATPRQLYDAVSRAAVAQARPRWQKHPGQKRACYFSAEFLLGRLVYSNLMNLGLLERCNAFLAAYGVDAGVFEEVEDDALGNGGLGRLAACFLDSAATHAIPLDGYGIRYRYGLFRQSFRDGFQEESPDDWLRFGDPWSVRREEDSVIVAFGDQTVRAVPYDMPVLGYGQASVVNTLRLWQSEPLSPFDFHRFNEEEYDLASQEKTRAQAISAVLYPNDEGRAGKCLRLKQQYFFVSASLQSLLRDYTRLHGEDFSAFAQSYAIQLNDTHPVTAIPELLRLLMEEHDLDFPEAFALTQATFAYTNHTIMAEALEKWDVELFAAVLPRVFPYVVMLQNRLFRELRGRGILGKAREPYAILDAQRIYMARMAIYASHGVNGVAQLHSRLLQTTVLPEWYALYPERFHNKTNGITQRRWLALCNPELSALVTRRIGDGWLTHLEELKKLVPMAEDPALLEEFMAVKREKKRQLCQTVLAKEGVALNPDFLFDVQVKRLHEYKRQLLNALSILDTYFGLKEGRITHFYPTAYLFGAKAAPGYRRAKGIIKLIHEVGRLVNSDPVTKHQMQVLFVQNYDVSYAEKLIPAADLSEQISTAGTEASGTGNMKLMLNGAVTIGTMDGATVEIVEQSGRENNYIFGATVEKLAALADYDPKAVCQREPRIGRVMEALVDGTLSDGKTGMFRELYESILEGASWHRPDQYFLLLDFLPYCDARLAANRDYAQPLLFAKKCLLATANAGTFSSDRTVCQYARDLWFPGAGF